MMGMINGSTTKQQVRRILAITVAANIFFIVRLLIELSTSLYLVTLWTCEHSSSSVHPHLSLSLSLDSVAQKSFSVMLIDRYWKNYILCKHWSEVIALALLLLISTATKSTTPSPSSTANSQLNGTESDERRTKRFKKYSPPLLSLSLSSCV
jgi:hypothetical protein